MRVDFVEHPRSVGQSYVGHMKTAASSGLELLAGGAACLVHAVLPFLFATSATAAVARVQHRLTQRRTLTDDEAVRTRRDPLMDRAAPPGG